MGRFKSTGSLVQDSTVNTSSFPHDDSSDKNSQINQLTKEHKINVSGMAEMKRRNKSHTQFSSIRNFRYSYSNRCHTEPRGAISCLSLVDNKG